MKQTQRSSSAARTRGLIQSETLENRRLFAGMPFGHGDYGHGGFGHGDFASPPGAGRFWADAVLITLPLGGQMRLTSNANSTTATSSAAGAAINATAAAASAAPAAVPVTVATTADTRGVAIAVTNRDLPAADQTGDDLVQQVIADHTPSPTVARSSSASNSSETAAATSAIDNGAVFGPFTLGPTAAPAARPMEDGFGSLLTLNPDAVDRSLRWQSQDATYRPRRAASPTATADEMPVDLTHATATATVEQAGLAPVAVEMAMRPLWQRVAAIAAGGLLVAANMVVRRRRANQAGILARRCR